MEQTRKQTDIAFTVSGRLAASCAVAYMALPTILFLLGWIRPLFSVPAAAAVAAAAVLLGATIPAPTLHFTRRQMAIYLCVLALSLLWLLAGGMTGITSQHADFVVRNPIYETLIRCDWPLVDAGGRPFIYYLAFWLPPALACKCFSCSDIFIINYVLTAWTGLGLALTLTVLWSRFRTATLLFLLLLIFQGPLDGIVRWGLHLFHLQGPLAHELYLTVLAFFGGVPPTMQLHNTFHHTTLLWLFLAMAAAWDIPPKYQLFLASLCLLASPIGSLGLLVFIAVRTLIRRTPVRQYFSSWTVLAGAALVLLAGIYFTSSNGNNRIRLYFTLHPDSEEALYLDPAVEVLKRSGIRETLSPSVYRLAANRLRRGKSVTPNYLLNLLKSRGESGEALEKKTGQSKESQEDRSGLCRHAVKTQVCDGASAVCPPRLEKSGGRNS